MRAFWALYVHELRGLWVYLVGGALVSLAFNLYLATRRGVWGFDDIAGWATMFMALLTFLALVLGAWVVQREWDNGTVYQLLALPVGGCAIVGAKFAAAATLVLVPMLMTFTSLMGTYWPTGVSFWAPVHHFGVHYEGSPPEATFAYFSFGAFLPVALLYSFWGVFLRIVSIWVRSAWRLFTGAAILGIWMYSWRLLDFFGRSYTGTLTVPWPGGLLVRGDDVTLYFVSLPLVPVVVALAAALVLFWFTGRLVERHVEV